MNLFKSTLVVSTLFALTACQSTNTIATQTAINPQIANKTVTQSPTCRGLSQAMQNINQRSTFEHIQHIDSQLKTCLPSAENVQIRQWMNEYHDMYHFRFLNIGLELDKDGTYNVEQATIFADVMMQLDNNEAVQNSDLKKLSPRIRYLIGLAQAKKLKTLNLCEGDFDFNYDYQKFSQLFSPYLPKEQAIFIQHLAKDNQDGLYCDAGLKASLGELIQRALFWQDYITKYPNSIWIDHAKHLYLTYREAIFIGSDNTQWYNDDITEIFNDPDDMDSKGLSFKAHFEQLAKQNNALGRDAKTLLNFTQMSLRQRQSNYPINMMDDDGAPKIDWHIAREQLRKALNVQDSQYDYDCVNAPLCVTALEP
ncbi:MULTISPECIES: hypothetical protein [unclassified Acinetobacter]|uniref:hypothetical protein n=1 Tax=unclassified Acinetobacter TaxID=196816 RepID=UPI0035B7173D